MAQGLFHLDNNDNLFFIKENGIYLLCPNMSAPVPIKNLEDFKVNERSVTDKLGNTYIRVYKYINGTHHYALASITKEALKEEIPQTTFVIGLNSTNDVDDLIVDEENNLWMAVEKSTSKLVNGDLKTIFPENNTKRYKYLTQSNGKTYFSAGNSSSSSIFYMTSNEEIAEVPDLKNLEESYFAIYGLVDSVGWIYFYGAHGDLSPSLGRIVIIKQGETKPIPIPFSGAFQVITFAELDFNDDLWLVAGDIYRLKKEETVPQRRTNYNEVCVWSFNLKKMRTTSFTRKLYSNFLTKRIYVKCADEGLFIVENI